MIKILNKSWNEDTLTIFITTDANTLWFYTFPNLEKFLKAVQFDRKEFMDYVRSEHIVGVQKC
ncbi:hypothetical protein KO465_04665 [Candidatus Micrarchaeota archaeon]|nr:hypothetical protein [Candidatus Micrarchaeota archaeon]